MRRITFVRMEDTQFGGAENFLRRLQHGLKQQKIAFDTQHCRAPKWLPSWVKALWFNGQTYLAKREHFYFSLSRIGSADIYRAGDGVHRVFMRAVGKHFWSNPMHWTSCWLERRCFKRCQHIIANSHMVKRHIETTYEIPTDKISVVYNGIDVKAVDSFAARQALCREFQLDPDMPIIVFVGSGWQRKGGDIFLRLLAQLNVPFQALMIGKDKHMTRYQQMAKRLGIADSVHFTGMRRDVCECFAAADILLFPTRYEPFSNVVLEAMAQKCVVLTSDTNGAAEILPKDQVLSMNMPETILPKLYQLLTQPDELAAKQQVSLASARQYPIEKCVDETLAVIKRLIA